MKNGNAIMLVLIMVPSMFFGTARLNVPSNYSEILGTPGHPVGHTIANCNDAALMYINCDGWFQHLPLDNNYRGTIVIMDVGLSIGMWKKLEQLGLDIIRYVSTSGEFGGYGVDSLTGVSDGYLDYTPGQDHGFSVASLIPTVVPNAQIVFIAMKIQKAEHGFASPGRTSEPWNWIKNNAVQYDIDVVSISWIASPSISSEVDSIITSLHDNYNVFLVSGIGNDPFDYGGLFPTLHRYVYSVGSVDHETRAKLIYWGYGYWSNDPDYYSIEGSYSGAAIGSELKSAYGSNEADASDSMDFVMPGHGVPYFSYPNDEWYYGKGTSFSAPYLASATLIAVYAFNAGYYSMSSSYQDPSARQVHELLKNAASETATWSQRMGYGYVDLLDLYNAAYLMGMQSYIPSSTCAQGLCFE